MLRVIALAVTLLSFPAAAQTVCSERSSFLDQLSERYSETPVALGLVSDGNVLEILASKVGTWTIIVTRPTGTSCVVATGQAWQDLPIVTAGPKA